MSVETAALVDRPKASEQNSSRLRVVGYACAFFKVLISSIGLSCAQALGESVPSFELNLWRFATQFVLCLPIIAWRRKSVLIERPAIPYMIVVCVSFNISNWTYYSSSRYIPVGTVGCVSMSIYLMLTAGVTFILSRQCKLATTAAVCLCLIGVLLTTQPEFIFHVDSSNAYTVHPFCVRNPTPNGILHINNGTAGTQLPDLPEQTTRDGNATMDSRTSDSRTAPESDIALGYGNIVLTAVLLTLITFTINKGLSEVDPFVISVWVSISGIGLSLVPMLIWESPVFPETGACQGLLMAHAIGVSLDNSLATIAMVLIPPVHFALMNTMELVYLFCAQYTVLRDIIPGHRNALELAGGVAVIVGNVFLPVLKIMQIIKPKYLGETIN